MHHKLFSTVVFNSINSKPTVVPLAEWRVCMPEECVMLRIIFVRIRMGSKCYKANRCWKMSKSNRCRGSATGMATMAMATALSGVLFTHTQT